jgi:hypothetical protein
MPPRRYPMSDGPGSSPELGPAISFGSSDDWKIDYAAGEVREAIGTSNAYTKPVGS